jgi:hypothetical protein
VRRKWRREGRKSKREREELNVAQEDHTGVTGRWRIGHLTRSSAKTSAAIHSRKRVS